MKNSRREFLKSTGLAGTGILTGITSAGNSQATLQKPVGKGRVQQFNMSGYAAPKLDTVRIGFIGLGNRGPAHLDQTIKVEGMEVKALCDLRADRVDEAKKRLEGTRHNPVLYTGNIKPHKNLVRLIEAFEGLRKDGFDDLKLLIIGDEISKLPALRRAVHRHKLHKYVRFLGFVKDDTLAILYRLAAVFVFPSLYEGFGLPPLEAMASGTPVVTSNLSSMPEVAGDAAVLVDPYDPQSIKDGISRVLSDQTLREQLRARGLVRARDFSWERSVARTRQIYLEAARGS